MPLSPVETLASIFVMAIVTFFTRALPFLLFDRKGNPPRLPRERIHWTPAQSRSAG